METMAIDFDVEDESYKQALVELKAIKLLEGHFEEVASLIESESLRAANEIRVQVVNDELLHRRFTI